MSGKRLSWQELRDRLHARILSGLWRSGDRLPRDCEIAREFGCARGTVQRAMTALVEMGWIERRRRGGSRVRPEPLAWAKLAVPLTRVEIEARGARYGYRLLSVAEEPLPPALRVELGVGPQSPFLRVQSLHFADDRPWLYEDRWVSLETVPEIREVDLAQVSANEWLVRHRPYSRIVFRFYARATTAFEAEAMQVPSGQVLLAMVRATFLESRPITRVELLAAPGYELVAAS